MKGKKPEPEPPLLMDRVEAARLLGVCERTLRTLERQGVFKPIRLGALVKYRRVDIEATLDRLAREARGESV